MTITFQLPKEVLSNIGSIAARQLLCKNAVFREYALALLGGIACILSGSIASAQTALTFERVVELLELEVKEEKLLALLKSQPTVFTLSPEQVTKLNDLKASPNLILAMTGKATQVVQSDTMAYAIILDVSGSMTELASNGRTKWEVAKASAIELVKNVPPGLQVAFIIYGHDKNRPCDVDVLCPLAAVTDSDKTQIINQINALEPSGKTPIARSLQVAARQLSQCNGIAKTLLITDGLETCDGDPLAEAKSIATSAKSSRSVDVIGFALPSDESAIVAKIAASGNGKYVDAKTSSDLASAFDQVKKEMHQKLSTSDGAVASTASKDPLAPTVLNIGTYTKARLAPGNYHYWSVDFPAGKFRLIYDVQCANEAGQVIGSASLGTYDGSKFNTESSASVSENDIRVRGVATFECSEPTTKLIQVFNGPYMTNIEDYHLGVFDEKSQFGVPFLVNSPEVKTLNLGQTVTSPLLGGAKAFYLDCDAFYKVNLPAGDFILDVQWNSNPNLADQFARIRSIDSFDLSGVRKNLLEHGKKNSSTRVKLQTADEQEFLLRVRAAAKDEKVSVKITPVDQ